MIESENENILEITYDVFIYKTKKFENVQGLGGKICHKIERDYLRLNNDGVIHVILFHNN